MKYVICGGTGFIGKELSQYWLQAGHEVMIVGRKQPDAQTSQPKLSYHTWDSLAANPTPAEGTDALINLLALLLVNDGVPAGRKRSCNPVLKPLPQQPSY